MKNRKTKYQAAFTVIEVLVTVLVALIVILGIGVYVVEAQRGFGRMYDTVHGDVAQGSYVAQRAFDGVVRKGARHYAVRDSGHSMVVDYWEDCTQQTPDCRARFYMNGSQLMLESGQISNPKTEVLAENVSDCMFYMTGASVQMILDFDDGRRTARVVSSAVQHND